MSVRTLVDVQNRTPLVIRKPVIETVNNLATVQDDDHFKFGAQANRVYWVEMFLAITTASITSDFKMDWSVPSGTTRAGGFHPDMSNNAGGWERWTNSTAPGALNSAMEAGLNANTSGLAYAARFTVSTTSGIIQFRWSQAVATVENTSIEAGSLMRVWQLA